MTKNQHLQGIRSLGDGLTNIENPQSLPGKVQHKKKDLRSRRRMLGQSSLASYPSSGTAFSSSGSVKVQMVLVVTQMEAPIKSTTRS